MKLITIKLPVMKKTEPIKPYVMRLSLVLILIYQILALNAEIREHRDAIATLTSSIADNEDLL
jgi:hypothetical protein